MSEATVREGVPAASAAGERHVFVIGNDGELLSWSARAPGAVPATVVEIVRGCIAPLAAAEGTFAQIALVLDDRFGVHIVRNAAAGPISYAVVIDELA